ncbi:hypothetical protein GQ457_07G006460 [Hibiscus cannabinus]
MKMIQARLVYAASGSIVDACTSSMEGFDILLQRDDKGDVSNRDNESGLGRLSRLGIRSRQSVLQSYWLISITKNNLSLDYNRANLRLVEDLEHNGW